MCVNLGETIGDRALGHIIKGVVRVCAAGLFIPCRQAAVKVQECHLWENEEMYDAKSDLGRQKFFGLFGVLRQKVVIRWTTTGACPNKMTGDMCPCPVPVYLYAV